MKKIYTLFSCAFVAILLCIGFYALLHPDADAAKPRLSLGALLDGSYSASRRAYFVDGFPQSQSLKNANTRLNGFYKFSAFSGGDDVSLIITMDSGAANGGASLKQNASSEPPVSTGPGATEPTEPDATAPTEPSEATERNEPGDEDSGVVETLGSALLIGNRAIEVPYADYDSLERYSAAVTAIADALGKNTRTFSIAVPNSAEFYTPKDYHTGASSQSKMIGFCYEKMGDQVITVDAYSKLAEHTDDYIYFRTDHHWTQLGAYYAYTAFCESAGLKPEPLSKFEQGQHDRFVGSMYNFLADYPQSSVLRNDPDTLYYYRPFVKTETSYYEDATLSVEYPIGCISYVGDDVSNKYLCFLGGDHPVTIINTDVKGPVCMILKESYGNAFAPWLTSHYSKIIVIDPREFNRDGKPSLDLATFAQEQGVNDCIVLNYPMMLSSGSYIDWLERLVN